MVIKEEEDWKKVDFYKWYSENSPILKSIRKIAEINKKVFLKILSRTDIDEKEEVERNDVYIYKTIKYPSKSKPPTKEE